MVKKILSYGMFLLLMYGLAACQTAGTGVGVFSVNSYSWIPNNINFKTRYFGVASFFMALCF